MLLGRLLVLAALGLLLGSLVFCLAKVITWGQLPAWSLPVCVVTVFLAVAVAGTAEDRVP